MQDGCAAGCSLALAAMLLLLVAMGERYLGGHEHELQAAAARAIVVDAQQLKSINFGQVIYLTGLLSGDGPVVDPVYGVSSPSLGLHRRTDRFEVTRDLQTGTDGKPDWVRISEPRLQWNAESWADLTQWIGDVGRRKETERDKNRPEESSEILARRIRLGKYPLGAYYLLRIGGWKRLTIDKLPPVAGIKDRSRLSLNDNWLYIRNTDAAKMDKDDASRRPWKAPKVGDLRVSWEVLPPHNASVIAQQTKMGLQPPSGRMDPWALMWSDAKTSKEQLVADALKPYAVAGQAMRSLAAILVWPLMLWPAYLLGALLSLAGRDASDRFKPAGCLFALVGGAGLTAVGLGLAYLARSPMMALPATLVVVGLLVWGLIRAIRLR